MATSSKGRADIVETLVGLYSLSFLILEKTLEQSVEGLLRLQNAVEPVVKTWVNTPRRVCDWHQCPGIGSNGLAFNVNHSGPSWGIACNAIHFIDVLNWWTGAKVSSVDTSGLDERWYESKRAGYFDIEGRLAVGFCDGSSLTLLSDPRDAGDLVLTINRSDGQSWYCNETARVAGEVGGEEIHNIPRIKAKSLAS